MTEAEKPRTALWPLIAVAVVAGSLPLLWANRAYLPAPKSGPFSNPDTAKPVVAQPAPVSVAPAPVAITQAPAAVPVPPTAPPPTPAASEMDPASPAPSEKAAPEPKKKKINKANQSKKAEAPRPCTEAVAALGLCDQKQGEK